MLTHRIKNVSDRFYKQFYDIYAVSFPKHEQRSLQQQKDAFSHEQYHLLCFLTEKDVAAFIAYWDFDDHIYIEHLAVNNAMRSKQIGTSVLRDFIQKKHPQPVILEIDPLMDEVAERRWQFYRKLDFVLNDYVHYHPSYTSIYEPHELLVLSTPEVLSQTLYDTFYDKLCFTVMKG